MSFYGFAYLQFVYLSVGLYVIAIPETCHRKHCDSYSVCYHLIIILCVSSVAALMR